MIYQIVSYDAVKNISIVQVAEDAASFEGARRLPISLQNIQTRDDFEKQVYLTYIHTMQIRERNFSLDVEMFVMGNVSRPMDFEIPIVPIGVAQSSTSDANVDDNSDPNAQVI